VIAFEDFTTRAGIDFEGQTWGIAWGDADGDGWQDLWATNHGDPRLYHNQGDGTFQQEKRFKLHRGDIHGAAWVDYDLDGDQDLLELTGAQRGHGKGSNHLYVNTERGPLERAKELGIEAPTLRGRAPFWLDFDRDGELDVLLACAERDGRASELFVQRSGSFVAAPEVFLGRAQAMFAHCASLGLAGESWLVVHGFRYPQVVLDLSTTPPRDITGECGLPATGSVEDAALADLDGDGTTDVYLARARPACEIVSLAADHAFVHLVAYGEEARGVTFRCTGPVTLSALPESPEWWAPELIFVGPQGTHPSAMPAELDPRAAQGTWNPERAAGVEKGVYVLFDATTEAWSVRLHGPTHDSVTLELRALGAELENLEPIGFEKETPAPRDALLVRRGGAFVDVAIRSGILPSHSLGVAAADFDNDTDMDLFVVTGTSLRNPPDILYENLGAGRFRSAANAAGAAGDGRGVGDAVAVADYDGDGFLDLLVSNGRGIGPLTAGPLRLYRNLGNGNHWLRVRLVGRSNLEPVGARVELEADGLRQSRTFGSQVHRGAQDERILHFGLAGSVRARVEVVWPDGARTVLEDVAADQVLELREGPR
jgi:hypothetical protein